MLSDASCHIGIWGSRAASPCWLFQSPSSRSTLRCGSRHLLQAGTPCPEQSLAFPIACESHVPSSEGCLLLYCLHAHQFHIANQPHLANQLHLSQVKIGLFSVQTLEEMDMEYRELAEESGIVHWRRVPALNTNPTFIDDLADAVLQVIVSFFVR